MVPTQGSYGGSVVERVYRFYTLASVGHVTWGNDTVRCLDLDNWNIEVIVEPRWCNGWTTDWCTRGPGSIPGAGDDTFADLSQLSCGTLGITCRFITYVMMELAASIGVVYRGRRPPSERHTWPWERHIPKVKAVYPSKLGQRSRSCTVPWPFVVNGQNSIHSQRRVERDIGHVLRSWPHTLSWLAKTIQTRSKAERTLFWLVRIRVTT